MFFESSMSSLCRFDYAMFRYTFRVFEGSWFLVEKIGVCERSNFVKVCGKSE